MGYLVETELKVIKQVGDLPREMQKRVNERVKLLADDPRPPGVEKLEGFSDAYRLRVGVYRVVYTVDDARQIITVVRVGHRRNVYKGFK